jgi:two-component system cell cycle response regulator
VPSWLWFVAACAVVVSVYFALPVGDTSNLLYTGVAALTTVALAAGVLRRRPAAWSAWVMIALGQASYTFADGLYYVLEHLTGDIPYPGPPDVFYLLAYPLLAAGLVVLVRRRTPLWQSATLIDATVVGTAATLLWWVYVLHPISTAASGSSLENLISVAYPVLDLLIFVVALRLMLGAGARNAAYYMIIASLGLMLVADTVYAVANFADTWVEGTWVDGVWLASYALLGAAGLHPSMRRLDERATVAAPDATSSRVAVLAVASLVGPAVLIIEHLRGRDSDVPALAAGCAIMFLLVLLRMAGVLATTRVEATTDALTGVYSRRFFSESLRVEIERAHRSHGTVGLVLIDVDHFKHVNDSYGHPAGDRTLVELARRLRAVSRPGDILARIGGEEFALVLPGADAARAVSLAERVRRFVSATPFLLGDPKMLPVTVSVGVAVYPGDGTEDTDLIRAADQALYAAKRGGRNRVVASTAATPPLPASVSGVPAPRIPAAAA